MDRICIENLEFIGNHGVFKEEKFLEQKFIISVRMETDTRKAGVSGELESSTHYGNVAEDIEKVFFSDSFDLIETLAEKIAEKILSCYPLISKVEVIVKKPWAPIKKHFDYVSVEIQRSRNIIYLSIGSNIGDKRKNLEVAIEKISKISNTKIKNVSTFLETEPFGDIIQENFLNACLKVETLFPCEEFLNLLLDIEKDMGRIRDKKWGPRIIDLDILFFNDELYQKNNLSVPHPYICERAFVLIPLAEIAPNFIHPLEKKTILQLERLITRGK
jgi:dihydroneopterin aldolase/2-amino-4-hydroxy-6-hydroxymethyldihydropteridine diphosphokinase